MTPSDASPSDPEAGRNEAFWREYLMNPDSFQKTGRRLFVRIPADPRCQLCAAPFAGFGGRLMRVIGKQQSTSSPRMCNSCEKVLLKYHGGAEVPGSMLFADIRGSTALAERMSTSEFHALLDRFYTAASGAVFANEGVVDKFVGDEVVAVFPPLLGENHAERAVAGALAVLRATGHGDPEGPWVPVGAGVHTGLVWFGALGEGDHVEITVVGDAVNTASRLAAQAGAGEVLVSVAAAAAAGVDPALERRSLELKGRQEAVEVVTLRAGSPPRVPSQGASR
ncbi:MAG: adenylate/guanylate cyclase domain-containing protein [Chloroflexi bacterium]|nr:adenylate/guanylate cyclase domain-containing protein [Chloroflexota bacterium]